MKRPHFKYYWEEGNKNVVVANVRTNVATRIKLNDLSEHFSNGVTSNKVTEITSVQWEIWAKANPQHVTPIPRKQARHFKRYGTMGWLDNFLKT